MIKKYGYLVVAFGWGCFTAAYFDLPTSLIIGFLGGITCGLLQATIVNNL